MKRSTALSIIFIGLAGSVLADEPRREDFAYEAPIALSEPGGVYRAPLTAHVYRGVTREDLGDLRVYNKVGEIVPHGISRPGAAPGKKLTELPVFPVPVPAGGVAGDVSMFVATGKGGSVIALKTGAPSRSERWAYIADASQTEDPLAALEISWGEAIPEGRFIGTLVVDVSSDLKSWRTIGQGALASLHRDDQVLVQKRIEIAPQRVKYLRLTWADPQPKVSITGVKAELRPQAEPARDWSALTGGKEEGVGEYRFELHGRMPIDRARIPLPMNSVARVAVLSRDRAGDPWVLRGQKTVFAVQSAERELSDNEIPLWTSSSDRQWLLRLEGRANGLGSTAPVLELGWIPHELVFVARGSAPFTLAYGHARVAAAGNYGVDELVRRSKRENTERVDIRAATFGTPDAVRGEAARTRPWYAEWRQWLLWAVLVAGVGILALLAVRLSRQIGQSSE